MIKCSIAHSPLTAPREMSARARLARQLAFLAVILIHLNLVSFPPHSVTEEIKQYLFQNSFPNLTTLSAEHGYTTETHTVLTDDGYLLTIFHMYKGKKCSGPPKSPPVIMMHGFLMSSDTWLEAGPAASLAYLLADACYDLWLANVRGTRYGRRHAELDPDSDPEFWDFSADEMGFYDIPATIDYVLKETGAEKVNYLGYSHGAGTFFIMCSERREYCGKVGVLLALAPATRLKYTKSVGLKLLGKLFVMMEKILGSLGVKELFGDGNIVQGALFSVCKHGMFLNNVCKAVRVLIDSDHAGSVDRETLKTIFGHMPAGTSVRTFARYGQGVGSDHFRKYDHGEKINLQVYGAAVPPEYNLSAVSTPTVVIHGESDHLIDPADLRWLARNLPNVDRVVIEDPLWNHLDFIYSHYNNKYVVPKLLRYLSKYS